MSTTDFNPNKANTDDEVVQNTVKLIEQELASIQNLSLEEKKEKIKDIKFMITYINDLTSKVEDRRISIANNAWQSLGIIVTAFGVIASLPIISIIKMLVLIILFILMVFTLMKLWEYHVQSGFRYPFLSIPKYSNKWKWFYYGNEYILRINEDIRSSVKTLEEDQILYLRGLNLVLHNYLGENPDKELENNLIQFYLLQVHNYFKNRFYLKLVKFDKYSSI